MYHHQSQQQGPQPFSDGSRPPHHHPPTDQHQSRTPSGVLSQVIGFQFPRPTQLPDELESALAIRGARDMDHRLIDHRNQQNQHHNQNSGSGISQPGSYGANPVTVSSDTQHTHQQGVDWSAYQPPSKLFVSPPPSASQQSQQQPQSSHTGLNLSSWTGPAHSVGGGEGQGLYTPESAGSILASFGLSNEDLEVLSHYPDDQLTPDTLPFILRDIQINKSGNLKTVASTSASFSSGVRDIPLPTSQRLPLTRSQSPEVPSLLTVTQTAGKVIDYGHASRANDENSTRETFKREPLSSERTLKMYPSSSSTAKVDKTERRQVHLEHNEPSKHGDKDYRRTSSDHCKSRRSPGREFPPASKARNLDQDYRRERPKPRPSSEIRNEDSSRRSLSSSSDSKPINKSKTFPTPAMISDFSGVPPKVYPHTCSLCHTQCDQDKDWVEHINTVSHTAVCRDLRNKYPTWNPNLPSRSGRYGRRALWDPKDGSPFHSIPRSRSSSPSSSPPHSKHRGVHGRPYSPHRHPRHHYTEHRFEYHSSGARSPPHLHQTTTSYARGHHLEKRNRELTGNSSQRGVKRPHEDVIGFSTKSNRQPSSSKQGPPQSGTKAVKSTTKPGPKSTKSPPVKKKKKVASQPSQDWSVADRLVYLTGIPNDASEQEVTDLVGSFGKINNVILMPCSGEEGEESVGQKASVCMVKATEAQALTTSTNLSIRGQQITASVAKKPEGGHCSDANNSNLQREDKGGAGENTGSEAEQKTSDKKGMVLITGLPENGWSESDIITLVPYIETPSDIIMAPQIGKVLVSVPDLETAEEVVKVNTFKPAKVKDQEVKMSQLKQHVGLNTPVALYNILMGSVDPAESPAPVIWSSLLVISNVPNTPSASSEVQKLVRRFGTVIKTLVLNNMVICEMATAAMALSVYKRFHTFPCIVQNNPLFFSRKPDSKAQTKVIAAYAESSETPSANGKGSQTVAAADKEEMAHEEKPNAPLEEMKEDDDGREEKNREMMMTGGETLGENGSNDEKIKSITLTKDVSNDLAGPDPTLEGVDVDTKDMATGKNVETSEENKDVSASEATHQTPASEDMKPCVSNGDAVTPQIHKQVTQEMVNVLLMECRTRFGSQPSNTAVSSCREHHEIQKEREQDTKEQAKNHPEEEKKSDKEKKVRKEKEVRERERREKERSTWEKEARAKRERDEKIRREQERRERKKAYGEGLPASKSPFRSQESKQSSWRDEHGDSPKAEIKMEEEDEDEFPFNISDFVTVDEVGDVTDLPSPVPMEAMEEVGGASEEDIPIETTSVATEVQAETDQQVSECETVIAPTAQTPENLVSAEPTHVAASQPEATEGQLPESAPEDSLNCPETRVTIVDSGPPQQTGEEKEGDSVSSSHVKEEMVVSNKAEEQKAQDDEHSHPGNQEGFDEQTPIGDKCVKNDMSTDDFLPPFDPSSPVGLEFLVPKTGFFCKACNRFFSGNKEAEINHCKTFKHYENLKKYLKTTQT